MKEQNPGIARARQSVRVLALAAALSQACVTTRAQTNPVIQRMVDSVSTTRLTEHIQALERSGGWYSRVNFTPGNDTAAVYLKQAFDSIPGLTTVEYDTFYISSAGGGLNTKPLVNIVATLRGTGDASRVFIAGAHLDCSGSRMGSSVFNFPS